MDVRQPEVAAGGRFMLDRGLLILIGGALVLIVAGLISVPLASRRTPMLAAPSTPEGTVQRFYQAAYADDYQAAYAFLSADTQRALSFIQFQQQISPELEDSEVRVGDVALHDTSATVSVTITHVQPGGILGVNEWQNQHDVVLTREGDTWKIVSGAFYVPPAR